ncbi:carbohydrate ABC transporter permease [Paenibacillus sp. GCM10027628]|uniref:carbohydrate ABC transporter permease n=1 Tax=Paenibacillus sp. GCM10027628 TaxID=3273413 RepID=UPI0036407834
MISSRFREEVKFYLFILPWIIGFLSFFIIPATAALIYSFTDYNAIQAPNWVGLQNFNTMFHDPIFTKSLTNTLFFVFVGVPVNVIFQIAVANLLNLNVKGIAFFRTFYYLPYLVPVIATVVIWRLIFATDTGIVNAVLSWFGVEKIAWLEEPSLIKPMIVTMGMWASGSGVIVFLAALKGVPQHLYDAIKVDGAGMIRTFFVITLPMISPAILFSLVMQMISSFQMFTEAFLLNQGGPDYASTTFMLNTYNTAFRDFHFGLAMAKSWILFLFILIITLVIMGTSRRWVYYEGEERR